MLTVKETFKRVLDSTRSVCKFTHAQTRPWRIMPADKLAEFGTFSGKFNACLVCG